MIIIIISGIATTNIYFTHTVFKLIANTGRRLQVYDSWPIVNPLTRILYKCLTRFCCFFVLNKKERALCLTLSRAHVTSNSALALQCIKIIPTV